MFDFLLTHNHTDNPTALGILITVLSSFFLASLVALTYQWTTPKVKKSNELLQSMMLLSIVAAVVMQAIGDSLARGLGMLGALAIIRFRTKLDNPRNMAFIFAALANGIACGVYGFTIAYIGTLAFCIVAIILRFSNIGTKDILTGTLKYQTPFGLEVYNKVENLLTKTCKIHRLQSENFLNINRTKAVKDELGQITDRVKVEMGKSYLYHLEIKDHKKAEELAVELDKIIDISDVRLKFGDIEEIL